MWTFNSVTRALHTWQMQVGNCSYMYVCVCWCEYSIGNWMNYASCRLLAIVSFMRLKLNLCRGNVFISCQSKTFDSIYAPCHATCHMPHIPAARMFHSLFSLTLPLSLSNCKRCWRLKYLIQQLHDGKTRPVYYCILYIHHALCVCVCVFMCVRVSMCLHAVCVLFPGQFGW